MKTPLDAIPSEIASGAYRNSYLLYARRSTDDVDTQKNSIRYQHLENARYAQRAGLATADFTLEGFCTNGVISERHSGFAEDVAVSFDGNHGVQYRVERPKFYQLLQFLAQGRFKGVVFLCWDRASRNKGDDTILRKLMKAGVDVRFARTEYDKGSAGELHMDIDGMFAEHHSRLTREKVTDTIRKKRDEGYCTHKAPVGYLNEGLMERKPFDSERAPLIRRLFELADTTEWSLSDLRRWLLEQGFTMPPSIRKRSREERLIDEERDERANTTKVCRPPGPSTVHVILTNRFYTGRTKGNAGVWVTSRSHERLVDDALFERVQRKLARRRTSIRHPKMLDHPFRGLLRCTCGRSYTPYEQKGRVYFGARCDRSCPNPRKSVKLSVVCEIAGQLLGELVLTDNELAQIDQAVSDRTALERQSRERRHDEPDRRLRKLREDLAYLADHRVTILRTGVFTPEGLVAEEARLATQVAALLEPKTDRAAVLDGFAQDVAKCSELLKTLQIRYKLATTALQEKIARLVFSELTLAEDTAYFKCTTVFRAFESRIASSSALDDWLSEYGTAGHSDELRSVSDDLARLLDITLT